MTLVLIIIGAVLIILNVKAVIREKNTKPTFQGILEHTDSEIDDFDIKIGELRREFSETILELQKEIIELKELSENKEISASKTEADNNFENIKFLEAARVIEEKQDNEQLNYSNSVPKKTEKSAKVSKQAMRKGTKAYKNSKLGINEKDITDDNKNENYNEVKADNKNEIINDNHNSIKINEIDKLINEGLSIDEISEKLGIGKGEVLLIKDLYIK